MTIRFQRGKSVTKITIIFEAMNYLDILFVVPLVYSGWNGFRKGLIIELFTLLALVVGTYGGIRFSGVASTFLADHLGVHSEYLPVAAFAVTFLAVGAAVFWGGRAVEKALKAVALGLLNKVAGMVFSTLKMWYIVGVLLVITAAVDERYHFIPQQLKDHSLLYRPLQATVLATIPALKEGTLFFQPTGARASAVYPLLSTLPSAKK